MKIRLGISACLLGEKSVTTEGSRVAVNLMKVTNEIYQVGGSGLTSHEDAAIYLINFGGSCALVDAGCGRSEAKLLDNIRSCGIDPEKIKYLLITHCHFDHTGGAKALRLSRRNLQPQMHLNYPAGIE